MSMKERKPKYESVNAELAHMLLGTNAIDLLNNLILVDFTIAFFSRTW